MMRQVGTGNRALLNALRREGVRHVFGNPGATEMAWLDLRRIQIYSPNPEHRARFVRQQQERLPAVEIQAVESEEQAVRGADVVVTATNALTPVLKGEWLAAGTHVVSISGGDRLDHRKEVDDETVARSSVVVVNSRLQVELDDQQDLLPVVTAGRLSLDRVIELGALVRRGLGRSRSPGEITFHFNNTGMGIQFAAVGTRMYEAALKRGVGTRLPYTWRGRSERDNRRSRGSLKSVRKRLTRRETEH